MSKAVQRIPTINTATQGVQSEIKISLPERDVRQFVTVNRLRMERAVTREVYFFDTPSFALSDLGLVLRARKTMRAPDDTTIKLRPMKRSEIEPRWLAAPGLKTETDIVGTRQIESCSLTCIVPEGKIDHVILGEEPLQNLFASVQYDLMDQHAKVRVDWPSVQAFGPIQARIWKVKVRGFSEPVTIELWRLPNNRRVLELSYKAPLDQAADVQNRLVEFLGSQGFKGAEDGDTKTRLAVRFFKGERSAPNEAPLPAAKPAAGAGEARKKPRSRPQREKTNRPAET